MSEEDKDQSEPVEGEPEPEGHGVYNPQAAAHAPYNEAMAAWFNEVRSMQLSGSLPAPREEPEVEPELEVPEQRPVSEPDLIKEPEEPEVVWRTMEEALDLHTDPEMGARAPESEPESFEGSETPESGRGPEEEPQGDSEGGEVNADEPPAEPGQKDAPEPGETYNPTEHNAPHVLGYLEGVGFEEAFRVLDLEERGRARKGILNHRDEILARAQDKTEDAPKE